MLNFLDPYLLPHVDNVIAQCKYFKDMTIDNSIFKGLCQDLPCEIVPLLIGASAKSTEEG